MAKTIVKTTPKHQPILYLNLRPFFIGGLFIALFSAPFLRGLFFQPEQLQMHMFIAVVFAFTCYDQILRREVSFLREREPLDYAVAALALAYVLSLFTAVHMRSAIGELLKYISYIMVYWIAYRAVRSEGGLDRLLAVCYAAAVGVAAVGLAAAAGFLDYPGAFTGKAITSTLQYENTLAAYLAALSLVGLALSVKAEKALPKVLYAAGNFLLLVVLLGTQSRGGWLIYPLGLAALFAGLPAAYRIRTAYHLLIYLSCGLVAARLYLPRLLSGQGREAVLYVLVLAAVTVLLQYAYHRFALWLSGKHITDGTRRAVALGGLAYLGFVAVFYLCYAAGAMPSALSAVLPSQVASRAETLSTGAATLSTRYEFTRDALRIAADHPITGAGGGAWNALYHQYQSRLYWSTEVHNYFAQTLVEAGIIGLLAALALWGCFIYLVVRLWRRSGREGGVWMSIWGAAVGAFSLGLHSAFDFDLSLPALGMLLWALFGAVRAGNDLPDEDTDLRARKSKVTEKSPAGKINALPGTRLALIALAVTVGAALLFVPAARFYAAGKYGAIGARAVLNQDFDLAEKHYLAAHSRDPLTADYSGDLAQIYAVQAISRDDAPAHFKALAFARKAAASEPYNTQVRASMVNVYLMLKEIDTAVGESEALLRTNPFLSSNYEIFGRTGIAAARYYLEQGEVEQAIKHIEAVQAIPGKMKEKSDEIRAGSGRYIKGDPLPPTPVVKLTAGQACYLAGHFELARQVLQLLAGDKTVGAEANLWLAASLKKMGDEQQAHKLLEEPARQDPDYYAQYRELLNISANRQL